jgi:hypothetical protein
MFPSPCGEKVENYNLMEIQMVNIKVKGSFLFPSPCGEKVENYLTSIRRACFPVVGFRPLAGKR